jgi:hypothetical protein
MNYRRDGEVSVLGESPMLKLKRYLHAGLWEAAHSRDPNVLTRETKEEEKDRNE